MADETHQMMGDDNSKRLRILVSVLAVVYVLTFVSGFLQETRYNFLNYIFFSLLFTGGIVLMSETVKSKQLGMTKGFLFLTGFSTTVLLIFYICYEWFRLRGYHDLEASMEALLYWLTLFFWIGVFGSLILIRKPKAAADRRSTERTAPNR